MAGQQPLRAGVQLGGAPAAGGGVQLGGLGRAGGAGGAVGGGIQVGAAGAQRPLQMGAPGAAAAAPKLGGGAGLQLGGAPQRAGGVQLGAAAAGGLAAPKAGGGGLQQPQALGAQRPLQQQGVGLPRPGGAAGGAAPPAAGGGLRVQGGQQPQQQQQQTPLNAAAQPKVGINLAGGGATAPAPKQAAALQQTPTLQQPKAAGAAGAAPKLNMAAAPKLNVGAAAQPKAQSALLTGAMPQTAAPKAGAAQGLGGGAAAAGGQQAQPPTTLSQSSTKLRNKTLGELINGWSDKLEEHVKSFTNAALVVASQDKQLLENGDRIFELHTAFNRITAAQRELDGSIEVIRTQQDELEQLLDALEDEIARAELEHPGGPDRYLSFARPGLQRDADSEREEAFRLAEDIHAELGKMGDALGELVGQINSNTEGSAGVGAQAGGGGAGGGGDSDPATAHQHLTTIVLVLNHHLNTLQWIEQNVYSMQGALVDASREFSDLVRSQERMRSRN